MDQPKVVSAADTSLSLQRIVAQRLAGPPLADPAAVVRWLGCVQGQDLTASLRAVAQRCGGGVADVVDAANAGAIVRSWPARGTLHWTCAADIRWMQNLTRPRMVTQLNKRSESLGITPRHCDQAAKVAISLIRDEGPRTRAELRAGWAARGLPVEGQATYHLIMRTCYDGHLVQGPFRGAEQLFAVADDWLTAERQPDRDEALAVWALAYFQSHGPASVHDFARWAALTIADARRGVDGAGDQLTQLEVDGAAWFAAPTTASLTEEHLAAARGTHLVAAFDELLLGYGERSCLMTPAGLAAIVPGNNGIFKAFIVDAGRAVGTWSDSSGAIVATPIDGAFSAALTSRISRAHRRVPARPSRTVDG